jgi:DNA recombination protein RmuC
METVLLVLVVVLILLIVGLIWVTLSRKQSGGDTDGLLLMRQEVADLRKTLDAKLTETNRDMISQLSDSRRNLLESTEKMTRQLLDVRSVQEKANQTSDQMIEIAKELQSLQDILKNPKQRGILGEYYLEALLKNVLPAGQYKMQYTFKDGEIVDAAVFVKDKIIPIDSKFSLENYNRLVEAMDPSEKSRLEKLFLADLKKRITETSKYIREPEGTMSFAFMFIPHEAIYYDLLVNKVGTDDDENLIQRAASKYHVIIVSPTSFLAYLQTVLQGLRAMEIEENIKETMRRVDDLSRHLKTYEEAYLAVGKHLGTVVSKYSESGHNWKQIDKDITRISGGSPGFEMPNLLEKPNIGE